MNKNKELQLDDAIQIIKKRFPEVALIVGLQVGLSMVANQISPGSQNSGNLPAGLDFILGVGFVVIGILAQMLRLGFLRTAAMYGTAQQEPKTLLVTGRPFFWRTLRFYLLLFPVYLFPLLIYISTMATKAQTSDAEAIVSANSLVFIIAVISVILIKPLALVPAVMVGKDKMVVESMIKSRKYRLRDAKPVLLLFLAWFCFMPVMPLLADIINPGKIGLAVMSAVSTAISNIIWLTLSLCAIGFIVGKQSFTAEDAEVAEEI